MTEIRLARAADARASDAARRAAEQRHARRELKHVSIRQGHGAIRGHAGGEVNTRPGSADIASKAWIFRSTLAAIVVSKHMGASVDEFFRSLGMGVKLRWLA